MLCFQQTNVASTCKQQTTLNFFVQTKQCVFHILFFFFPVVELGQTFHFYHAIYHIVNLTIARLCRFYFNTCNNRNRQFLILCFKCISVFPPLCLSWILNFLLLLKASHRTANTANSHRIFYCNSLTILPLDPLSIVLKYSHATFCWRQFLHLLYPEVYPESVWYASTLEWLPDSCHYAFVLLIKENVELQFTTYICQPNERCVQSSHAQLTASSVRCIQNSITKSE